MSLDAAVVFAPVVSFVGKLGHLGLNSFSSPPTIAEINASSDFWQVYALYNRRISQILVSPPAALAPSTTPNHAPSASDINTFRTAINSLRVAVGLTNFSFGSNLASGDKIKAQHLVDLRSAINFSNPFPSTIYSSGGYTYWETQYDPYPGTITTHSNYLSSHGIGKFGTASPATRTYGFRLGQFLAIGSQFTTAIKPNVTLGLSLLNNWINNNESGRCAVYASSSDDSAFGGSWGLTSGKTLVGYVANGTSGLANIPMVYASILQPRAGSNLSLLVGQEFEMLGSGAAATGTDQDSFTLLQSGGSSPGQLLLSFDFGF